MSLPSYLKRTSFGTWHFRIKVPKRLVQVIGQTEIRRTLETKCELTASRRALVFAEEAKQLFERKSRSRDVGSWLTTRAVIGEGILDFGGSNIILRVLLWNRHVSKYDRFVNLSIE